MGGRETVKSHSGKGNPKRAVSPNALDGLPTQAITRFERQSGILRVIGMLRQPTTAMTALLHDGPTKRAELLLRRAFPVQREGCLLRHRSV